MWITRKPGVLEYSLPALSPCVCFIFILLLLGIPEASSIQLLNCLVHHGYGGLDSML